MEECSICLTDLKVEIAKLECGHTYHFECIGKYQQHTKTIFIKCPLCRMRVNITDVYDIVLVANNPIKVSCENIYITENGRIVGGKPKYCCHL